jgi:hypothetical protein
MPDIQYSLIDNNGHKNITVFYDGQMYAATEKHRLWDEIVAGAKANDPTVIDLFDIGAVAQARFERLSDRVTVKSGKVYFDNQPTHNALTEQVVRFIDAGQQDFRPLVEFFEKVQSNPNEHSREQLYTWLDTHDFAILPNGNFIGYKGVRVVRESLPDSTGYTEKYESISHGSAISDGVEYNGAIPNPIGAVVEMPRDAVQHDPSVGCHTGLHVGTWSYAHGFAQGAVLKVEVNPRDVVSVPTDCSNAKLRTCRYTVLDVIDAPLRGPLDYDDVDDEEDEPDFRELDVKGYLSPAAKSRFDSLSDSQAEDVLTNTIQGLGVTDTRKNHLRQKRDRFGRFIPKS